LRGIVELGGAADFFAEDVVHVAEGFFEHGLGEALPRARVSGLIFVLR